MLFYLFFLVAMVIIVAAGILVCSLGLQKGVERITKIMMSLLPVILVAPALLIILIALGWMG